MYVPSEHQIRVETIENEIRELRIEARLLRQSGRITVAAILGAEIENLKQELCQLMEQADFCL